MRRLWTRNLLVMLVLLLSGCGIGLHKGVVAPQPATPGPSIGRGHTIKHVIMILMENHNWSSILGSSSAPYINKTLLPMASSAAQYYNPPHLHPSLPNYLWLEAGTNCFSSTGCIRSDGNPDIFPISSTMHLTTLLHHAGISWRAYAENMPVGTCPLTSAHLYAPRHVPFLFFDDVSRNIPYCKSHIRPFTQLSSDLAHNTMADYTFITPNVCDDMHTPCTFPLDTTRQGDTWLSRVVPSILASRWYRAGGAVFITWDEAGNGDGPIGMIVLSPDAKGHNYVSHIHYTHSSTLRTMEEIFGVRPFLGGARDAASLRDLFKRFP